VECPLCCSSFNYRDCSNQCFTGLLHGPLNLDSGLNFLDHGLDFRPVHPVAFTADLTLPVSFQCRLMISQLEFLLDMFLYFLCINQSFPVEAAVNPDKNETDYIAQYNKGVKIMC
jgi:hypothetical protein